MSLTHLPNPPAVGRRTELPLGAPYGLGTMASMMIGVRSNSGQFVTPERALRASAVLACIRILSEDLSALPLNLYRRTPQGAVLAIDHPLFRLLHDSPNPFMTSMELRESAVLDMLCYGQSFSEKIIGKDGISALFPVSASRMVFNNPLDMFVEDDDPPLVFRYADPRYGQRVLLSDDLWITRMLAPAATVEGQSIVLLAREAIGLALAAEEQGARLFSQGVQTDLTLLADGELDDDGKTQLRDAFMKRHSGSANAWMPMLLENGMKAERIGLTAQESQYIEARQFQLADIARIFRIPDVLLGISTGKTATFASAEQFFLSYTKHTLQPWCTRIEQSINRDLLATSETDLFAKHDLDALMRADLQTRYSAHASGINAGFLTRNEARRMENLVALPGLDEPIQPSGGGGQIPPAQGAGARSAEAERVARQLAVNCVAHETRLLGDGKLAGTVYQNALPTYLRDKTGLSAEKCAEYCRARLAGEADGIGLLTRLLIAG